LYLGLAIGSLNRRLYRENVFVAVITTFVSTIIYEALLCLFNLFIFNASARINVHAINALKRVILLEAAYNGVFSVFIYMFLMKLIIGMKRPSKRRESIEGR
jgi:rod shape-determining protein MreD